MPGEIDQIARCRQHVLGPARDFAPDIGQHHVARAPFHHGDAERALEVADLHRQRGLGDGTGLGGATEMAVFGECGKVTKLSQRDHFNQIN